MLTNSQSNYDILSFLWLRKYAVEAKYLIQSHTALVTAGLVPRQVASVSGCLSHGTDQSRSRNNSKEDEDGSSLD